MNTKIYCYDKTKVRFLQACENSVFFNSELASHGDQLYQVAPRLVLTIR